MKKILSALLALCILLSLCACTASSEQKSEAKLQILCTLFPQYDWLRNITNGVEGVEVSLIIANGTDPHSYQPTAADIMSISNCDMLVFVGGDSDTWVKKAIERSKNQNIKAVALTELEGITLQKISAESHSHEGHSHEGHSHGDDHAHEHSALDEHLYLSLNNAIAATVALTKELNELDPENAEAYSQNAADYASKLIGLNKSFEGDLARLDAESKFILFADRFPFVYLLSDYGIHYAAAFEGCTTDVDADFDTVIRLIHEADEHNVKYIAVTESADTALASTVISSTQSKDQKIITLNSMQAITKTQIENGATYLSVMEENINKVKTALGLD